MLGITIIFLYTFLFSDRPDRLFSFIAVYLVEKKRLENDEQAIDIAAGAVIARVIVIFLKVGFTVGMLIWLVASSFAPF